MAESIVTIVMKLRGATPASVANRLLLDDASAGLAACAAELEAAAMGARNGKVQALVESSTAIAATGSVACTQASATAGDKLLITYPGFPTFTLTAVSGTPDPTAGEFAIITSDTAMAVSMKAAVNGHTGLRRLFSADNSSGTLTITDLALGSTANGVVMVKSVTDAGAMTLTQFSGGADIGAAPSETCTLGGAALTANDTLTIGSVVLTWKASAAAEGEVTIGGDDATSLANLLAKVNAHSKLQGLVLATSDLATILTITWLGPPRAGELLYFAKSASNASAMVITGSGTFRSTPTEAYYADRKVWGRGAP